MIERRSRWINQPTNWDEIETDTRRLGRTPVTYLAYDPATGLLKIGSTTRLHERLSQLRSTQGAPVELLSYRPAHGHCWERQRGDALDVERDLQDEFRQHNVRGEWFRPAPEIYAYFGCLA